LANGVDADAKFRAKLAISIVLLGIVGMFLISGFAVWLVGAKNRAEMMRLVFASILPLLGTWVGTVLAFYFARESLQAATDSTARLMGTPDPKTPARQVMIPKARIAARTVASGGDPKDVALDQLMELMAARKVHRIPVLDATGAVLFVVHDSMIHAYLAELPIPAPTAGAVAPDPLTGKTVADLLNVPDFKKLLEAIAIVGPAATIADARTAMTSVEGCNDVFITSNGQRTDPVEGWLTNTDLAGWV